MIQQFPPVRVFGVKPQDFRVQDLGAIHVNDAILEVGKLNSGLISQTQTTYCVLAMLGLANYEIGDLMSRSPDTVKTQISRSLDRLGIKSRAGIGRILLGNDIVNLTQMGTELGITPAEYNIIDGVTRGLSNREIALENILSPLTVKSHLERIARRTGCTSRELIGLSAMLSGEITNTTPVVNELKMETV